MNMWLLPWLQWLGGGIGAVALGTLGYRFIYRHFFRGYENTRIWLRKNKNDIQSLSVQAKKAHPEIAQQIKWLHGQVFEALFTDYILSLTTRIKLAKEEAQMFRDRLEGLDKTYDDKSGQIAETVEELWSREIGKYQSESVQSHERMVALNKEADELREKLAEEQGKVAEAETRQNTREAGFNRLVSRLEEYKEAVPSALQSVLSLWLVFLLLAIDFLFAHRSLEAFVVQYSPVVQFLATTILVIPLIALFDLIYSSSAKTNSVISKMVQFVTVGACVIAALSGIPDLMELRAGGDVGAAGHSLDLFVLKSLPLVAYLAAHFIHQWQHSGKRRDALMVFIMYAALSLQVLFAKTWRSIFGVGKSSNPRISNLNRELATKLKEVDVLQARITEINDKLIPDIGRKKADEVQTKQKQVLGFKDRERKEIVRALAKKDRKATSLENELGELKRGSTTACQRFMVMA